MRPRTDTHTDRQTHTHRDARDHNITYFASSTTHAKCNEAKTVRMARGVDVGWCVGDGLWVREARAGSYVDAVWHARVHRARDHSQQGDITHSSTLYWYDVASSTRTHHRRRDSERELLRSAPGSYPNSLK